MLATTNTGETAYQRMVRGYAYAIYIYGTRSFSAVGETYHEDVERYAALKFAPHEIENALAQGWITQLEYDQTVEKVGPYPTT